jgi:hypothetical protein
MWIKRLKNKIFKNNQTREVKEHKEIELINARLGKLEGDLEKAVSGYKLLLIKNNPDILAEMITGRSIEEIDRSLTTARELTNRIRENLEKKTAAERIPGGAPPRSPPDTDNLSSSEKIRYGLKTNNQ